MRVALFSDIHGHITGLKAVFARIEQLGGADRIYAVGDILGGGPGTEDVLELLLKYDVQMLMGNWDEVWRDAELEWSKLVHSPRSNRGRNGCTAISSAIQYRRA